MTARGSTTRQQLADEMRARVLSNREAWRTLMRPVIRDFDDAPARLDNDDATWPLAERDPRAIALEYEFRRRRFWNEHASAGEVRLHARRCVMLARYLIERAL